jgi:hypothetical protein
VIEMFTLRPRGIAGLLFSAWVLGATLVGACAEKKGALVLAINTDMKAPKDVNAVAVAISTNGALKYSFVGRVSPQGEVLLPATLAIVEPEDKSASIRIRVVAFQDRKPRVMRDVRTTVPGDGRTALLRVPLNFVNDASVVGDQAPLGVVPDPLPGTGTPGSGGNGGSLGADFDYFAAFQPPCPDIINQTIIDGECKDSFVDPTTLPDFDEGALGNAEDPGACFDPAECFAGAAAVPDGDLDRAACILQLHGANAARVNLALVTADIGECVRPGECYVPIDRGAGGWTDAPGGGAQLPPFVCRLLTAKNLHLAASVETCPAKVESSPFCRAGSGGGPGGACTEIQPPAPVNPAIGGSAASLVAVQSIEDYAALAAGSVDGATASCKKIAQDLGAPKADQDAADALGDRQAKVKAWCTLAVAAIGATKAKAAGTFTLDVKPTLCRGSVQEKGNCQSLCAGTACDLKANPPRCTGGSLIVECQGSCIASGGSPTVKCEGACSGGCAGACTAGAGVECVGVCTGTCTASASGTGLQPDGTCKGTCVGTCSATAPGVSCAGACTGACSGSCKATPQTPAKCDGVCDAGFTPLYCEAGTLEGGCAVDAKCDASCNVTVAAKADCPVQPARVTIVGAADAAAATALITTLESNLGAILTTKARLSELGRFSGTVQANNLVDIKAACIPVVQAMLATAVGDATASLSAVANVSSAVGQ